MTTFVLTGGVEGPDPDLRGALAPRGTRGLCTRLLAARLPVPTMWPRGRLDDPGTSLQRIAADGSRVIAPGSLEIVLVRTPF